MHYPAAQALLFTSSLGIHVLLSIPREASKWKAPAVDTLKINIDAGFTRDGNTFWDMLVRDCAGSVIYAAMKTEEVQVFPVLGFVVASGPKS
ncbi:hypothetical protein L195_g023863 [Trifolium pratense]|uniref:Uncharacterized protein n=2 Tax=Trifolium pratense TaxID=57577 RepID=A0A2K3NBW9_TRIPR|nr:hypothetical protein L195_g023811 [Trifolium pratense]PNY00580.1 hypothetical protein L195_g023863 [Trifolium pratense]